MYPERFLSLSGVVLACKQCGLIAACCPVYYHTTFGCKYSVTAPFPLTECRRCGQSQARVRTFQIFVWLSVRSRGRERFSCCRLYLSYTRKGYARRHARLVHPLHAEQLWFSLKYPSHKSHWTSLTLNVFPSITNCLSVNSIVSFFFAFSIFSSLLSSCCFLSDLF